MKDIKKLQIIFLVVLCATFCSAQQYLQKVGIDRYLVDKKKYNFEELGPIFRSNPLAYYAYEISVVKRKQASNLGWITVGTGGLGLLLISAGENAETGSSISDFVIGTAIGLLGAALIVVIVPITGTIALLTLREARDYRNSAFSEYHNRNPRNNDKFRMDLSFTQNGAGLRITF